MWTRRWVIRWVVRGGSRKLKTRWGVAGRRFRSACDQQQAPGRRPSVQPTIDLGWRARPSEPQCVFVVAHSGCRDRGRHGPGAGGRDVRASGHRRGSAGGRSRRRVRRAGASRWRHGDRNHRYRRRLPRPGPGPPAWNIGSQLYGGIASGLRIQFNGSSSPRAPTPRRLPP